jgi:nitroreductase
MSKVLEEMKTRRSIRKFKPDVVPQDILDRIIEAGTFAASGRGCTEHHYYSGDKQGNKG